MKNHRITHEELLRRISYTPETGEFVWRYCRSKKPMIGKIAGCIKSKGYRYISIDGVSYRASILAWFYMTGEWPNKIVDHRNRSRDDDRWGNLRLATTTQNSANTPARSTNKIGLKGVVAHGRKYRATIYRDGVKYDLGLFKTPELAAEAYIKKDKELSGEFSYASRIDIPHGDGPYGS